MAVDFSRDSCSEMISRNIRSSVSVQNRPRPRKDLMPENEDKTVVHEVTDDFGVDVGKWEAMLLSHNRESISLFDCEHEEELKVGIKYKEKTFSSWDCQLFLVELDRKIKNLNGYAKQLVESHDLDIVDIATKQIKEMIMGDSKLAAGLEPCVFERLVNILVDENNNESTKGSAAYILAFANFGIKEKTIKVLVKLVSDDRDTISIPVLRTLTRLAYFSAEDASFIVENGALDGVLAVSKPVSPKRIQVLAKFLVVVVRQVEVPEDKVGAVVIFLKEILEKRRCSPRCIMRACYTLSYIKVEWWVNEGSILNNVIDLIWNPNDMVATSALKVAATLIVTSEEFCEILTKHKFLKYLGYSEICCKPKKFQKEACQIISNMAAARGGTSIKDLDRSGLMDALVKLLEVDDFDIRKGAALAIENVINYHVTRDVTVS